MECSAEDFVRIFPQMSVEVLLVKKVYLTKYILLVLNAEGAFAQLVLEKKTEDLRRVYKQVRKLFPNFPIGLGHTDNFYRIVAFAREELLADRPALVVALHAFFFLTKNQNVIRKEYEKELERGALSAASEAAAEAEADSVSQLSLLTFASAPAELPGAESRLLLTSQKSAKFATQTPGDETLLTKIFEKLFAPRDGRLLTNFQRMSMHEKLVSSINYPALSQEIFEVQFRTALDPQALPMCAVFADGAIYLYDEKRKFLANKSSFLAVFVLVKVEQLWLEPAGEQCVVVIADQVGQRSFEFGIASACRELFVALLIFETLRRDSPLVDVKRLPEPFDVIGYAVVYLDELPPAEAPARPAEHFVSLHSTFLRLVMPLFSGQKRLVLPLMNVFDIFELAEGSREMLFESLALFSLPQGVKEHVGELEHYQVSVARLFNYLQAYIHPPLENYHESRFQSGNLTSSLRELGYASFRLKRMFALRDALVTVLVEFSAFKYPLFTTLVLLACMALTVVAGLGYVLLLLAVALVTYCSPRVQPAVDRFLFRHAFTPARLNAHYKTCRHLAEKEKKRLFHIDLGNIQNKAPSSTGIKGKLQGALDLGAKLPLQLHVLVDAFEKTKNMLTWRDERKTQLFLFILLLLGLAGNVLGKDKLFLLICASKFFYDVGYYKRVGRWNREVLEFLVQYFLQKENPQFEGKTAEFFEKFREDEQVKLNFSKRFSEFLLKYIDIKTDEAFWSDKFSLQQICDELFFSTKRILLPFYERKRQPNIRYLSLYFWFSTPSDFYYHHIAAQSFLEEDD